MPQITVSLEEMVYMDLIHNLPKGMKSAFVNKAIAYAITNVCGGEGFAMHKYAREGVHAATETLNAILARRHDDQENLKKWNEINTASLLKNQKEEEE